MINVGGRSRRRVIIIIIVVIVVITNIIWSSGIGSDGVSWIVVVVDIKLSTIASYHLA